VSRTRAIGALVVAALIAAPAARAAPTCQDALGRTIKCGVEGAMPVGWTLAPELQASQPFDMWRLYELLLIVGAFVSLVAIMPEFDGSLDSDWDRQEGDDDR
jgi:hypothetical protein